MLNDETKKQQTKIFSTVKQKQKNNVKYPRLTDQEKKLLLPKNIFGEKDVEILSRNIEEQTISVKKEASIIVSILKSVTLFRSRSVG